MRQAASANIGKVVTRFLAGLALAVAGPALGDDAEPRMGTWIAESELRTLMLGRPMAGVYPDGTPWRETIKPDGSSDYVENGKQKPGRWWFDKEGYLCFNYPATGTGGCFKYVRLTANCYEHFSKPRLDDRGVPDTSGSVPGGLMTNGKLWSNDRPSTCEAEPTV